MTQEFKDRLVRQWNSISRFVNETDLLYKNFIEIIKQYVKNKIETEKSEQEKQS